MKKLIFLAVMFVVCDRYITYKVGQARHYVHAYRVDSRGLSSYDKKSSAFLQKVS